MSETYSFFSSFVIFVLCSSAFSNSSLNFLKSVIFYNIPSAEVNLAHNLSTEGFSSETSQQSQIQALSEVFYGVKSHSCPYYFKMKKFATIL